MKNKTILLVSAAVIILGFVACLFYFNNRYTPSATNLDISSTTSITYSNTEYGFNFTLPTNWLGHSIIKDVWKGTALKGTPTQSGAKIIIRNPKWTASAPYEDLPILIFTIAQWNTYADENSAENFSIGAAPIRASELARNNRYVFALPARWDFDYSLNYKEAQDIMAGKPLSAFNVGL